MQEINLKKFKDIMRRRDPSPSTQMRNAINEWGRKEDIKKEKQELEKAAKEKERVEKLEWNQDGVGGAHPAWNIIIGKLDFHNQWKISQQNKRLADVVATNAESQLRKFRRHIQEDKYM